MNADDLRDGLARAVEPVQPSPASYDRLRASIARRRRDVYVVAGAAAVSLAAVAVAFAAAPKPQAVHPAETPTPTPTASPTPTATPTPSPTAASPTATRSVRPPGGKLGAATGDVDGDGTPDRARLVYTNDGERGPGWRWGVSADMSSLGRQTIWRPVREGGNEMQLMGDVYDVDGDGRGEVVVSPGGTAFGVFYQLVRVVDGRLAWVEPDRRDYFADEQRPDGGNGWGCADESAAYAGREVYNVHHAAANGRTTGTRNVYRLAGAKLVFLTSSTRTWTTGATPPAGYATGTHCGSLRRASP